jgi:hypothetical protein
MTTTLISPNEALQAAATGWPDDVTEVIALLGEWLAASVTGERARRLDLLIESRYAWLEATDGTLLNPLLSDIIWRAEAVQNDLLRTAEAAPSLF